MMVDRFGSESSIGPTTGRVDVSDDARGDVSERFVGADSAFLDKPEWLPAVVPFAHLPGGEGVSQLPRLVASNRLFQADVELIDACDAPVVSPELFQSTGIVAEVEDAVEDDVIPEVQRLTSGGVDECCCVGRSRFLLATSQKLTSEVVLMDHCGFGTEQGSQRRGSRRLT